MLEMYVVSCGRAVSVSVDSVSNRTGAWQLQWIDDSLVGDARSALPQLDGCDAAGTPWNELVDGSEWGEVVSPLEMELQYQQRGMPAGVVARGVGVGPGQGITGASMSQDTTQCSAAVGTEGGRAITTLGRFSRVVSWSSTGEEAVAGESERQRGSQGGSNQPKQKQQQQQ